MTSSPEIFSEIRDTLRCNMPLPDCYAQLYALLRRICVEQSAGLDADFSGLFSRLYAVCKAAGIDYHAADLFRRNARLVLKGQAKMPLTEARLKADAALLCDFIGRLYHCPVPADLPAAEPADVLPGHVQNAERIKKLRAVVTAVMPDGFTCISERGEIVVNIPHLTRTLRVLSAGMPVNLLETDLHPNATAQARLVIIDPDYLIDVSALTAAMKPYGSSAAAYLLDLLSPREVTLPILLGNAANRFMDDLVNTSADLSDSEAMTRLYDKSLRQHFLDNMLDYACLDTPLTAAYFEQLKSTFANIRESVARRFPSTEVGLPLDNVLLEPSFICEALGLRGRLDVMAADHRSLVELKSGRAEEFGGQGTQPRRPHVLQMSLYKEMLHYNFNLPRDRVKSFLFYSRYPVFYAQRSSAQAVSDVLELRNEIVTLEARLREGHAADVLKLLTPDALNAEQLDGRFWEQYLKPQIKAVTTPLQRMTPLERSYWLHFITFIEREKFLSKTTDCRPDSNRGLASAWATDWRTKMATGDILIDLQITALEGTDGIEIVTLSLPDYGDDFIANFAPGEMVQLYERQSETDNVTTRQLVRGYIEALDARSLRLRLANPQRNRRLFSTHTRYAMEHDGSDVPFTQALRGLHSLLTAEPRRRNLLLGQQQPEVATEEPVLLGNYPATTAAIVRQARRARDYFLLVGPPGTGKTSVALRAMVEEHLLQEQNDPTGKGLLLMAYTNRAVDEICGMLNDIKANYVRIGAEQTCGATYRPRLLQNLLAECRNRPEVVRRLQSIPIVAGTVATLTNHLELFRLRPYDAIIDEASQVLEPQLLGLLCARDAEGGSAVRRFVMIGDHKQLPAVVLLPSQRTAVEDECLRNIGLTDLRNSLFQRLHTLQQRNGWRGIVAMLDRQGRMHTDICDFVNDAFYEGMLRPVPLPHQSGPIGLIHPADTYERFVANTRMGFIDVVPPEMPHNNKANAAEAHETACLIKAILHLNRRNNQPVNAPKQIGVIVPFRNQITMVRHALSRLHLTECEGITIDTVECYQGSQRDYIIFTTTISRPYQLDILSAPQQVGNELIDRKLNVALTRARRQFFMVGNGALLKRSEIYRKLIAHCHPYSKAEKNRFNGELSIN